MKIKEVLKEHEKWLSAFQLEDISASIVPGNENEQEGEATPDFEFEVEP